MSGASADAPSATAVGQPESSPENRISSSAAVAPADGPRDGTPLSTTGSEATQQTEFRQSEKGRAAYLIKWGRFDEQLSNAFSELFCSENFADVTLACDGGDMLKAHKIILAMSSPFFRRIFTDTPCKHPIVVLKEFTVPVMKHILQYLYMGRVVLSEHEISSFMDAADFFGICGVIPDTYSCDIFATTIPDPDQRPTTDKEAQSEGGLKLMEASRTSENDEDNDGDEEDVGPLTPDERTIISHSPVIKYHFKTRWTRRYSGNSFSGAPTTGVGKEHKRSASAGEVESVQRSFDSPSQEISKIPRVGEKCMSQPASDLEISIGGDDERMDEQEPTKQEFQVERRIIQRAGSKAYSTPAINLEDSEEPFTNEWRDHLNYSQKYGPSSSSAASAHRAGRSSSLLIDFSHPLQSVDPSKHAGMYKSSGASTGDMDGPSSRFPHFPFSSTSQPPQSQMRSTLRPNRDSGFPSTASHGPTSTHSNEERFSRYHLPSSASSTNTSPTAYRPQDPHRHFSLISSQGWPYQDNAPHRHRFNFEEVTRGNAEGRYPSEQGDQGISVPNLGHSSRKIRSFPAGGELSVSGTSQYPMPLIPQLRSPPLPSSSSVTRPKTKAIRSSQVPQSSRYTAAEVDQMVDAVANYPGNIVPCTLCQKFVKRERLRAHIHECHLLSGEKIICPHCGIALKSKGSFRVHIWRHKRGALPTRNSMNDFNSGRPPSPTSGPASN